MYSIGWGLVKFPQHAEASAVLTPFTTQSVVLDGTVGSAEGMLKVEPLGPVGRRKIQTRLTRVPWRGNHRAMHWVGSTNSPVDGRQGQGGTGGTWQAGALGSEAPALALQVTKRPHMAPPEPPTPIQVHFTHSQLQLSTRQGCLLPPSFS